MTIECPHEQDVCDAIASGRWPDRAGDELKAHVARCTICGDVAEVAASLMASQANAWIESASVPSADIVWYRAQAQARADAAGLAGRPVLVMQAIGMASVIGALAGLGGIAASWLPGMVQTIETSVAQVTPTLPQVLQYASFGPTFRIVLLAAAFWLVLTPVALYLAAAEE